MEVESAGRSAGSVFVAQQQQQQRAMAKQESSDAESGTSTSSAKQRVQQEEVALDAGAQKGDAVAALPLLFRTAVTEEEVAGPPAKNSAVAHIRDFVAIMARRLNQLSSHTTRIGALIAATQNKD